MKTRFEYTNNGDGIDEATSYKSYSGGRVVLCYKNNTFSSDNDSKWLERVFWYSPQYTQSDIFNELKFDEVICK